MEKNYQYSAYLIGVLFFAIALILKLMPPPKKINHWLGYRTPRSLKCQANWDFANALFVKLFFYSCITLNAGQILLHLLCNEASKNTLLLLLLLYNSALIAICIYIETQLKKHDFCQKDVK